MRPAMSTLVYARRERLHPGLLDKMVSGGAEAIEIFAARGHFNYSDRQHVREITNWFRSTGISFHSMHSPMYGDDEWGRSGAPPLNIAAVEKRDRIAAMDEIKRAIEVAEQGAVSVSGAACRRGRRECLRSEDGIGYDLAGTSTRLCQAVGRAGWWWRIFPTICRRPEGLVELLHAARFTDVGVCFDVGHAHLAPGVPQAFETLKDLIRTTHVHDNDKQRDAHLWPGQGSIDWKETLALLRTAPQRSAVAAGD